MYVGGLNEPHAITATRTPRRSALDKAFIEDEWRAALLLEVAVDSFIATTFAGLLRHSPTGCVADCSPP